MNYAPAPFQTYLAGPDFFKEWGSKDLALMQEGQEYNQAMWEKAITLTMRIKAVMSNLVYGILANGPYWVGSVAFVLLMKALVGGSYAFHCVMYLAATVLSYVLARVLPLKRFSSDGDAVMRPLEAGLRNGVRMLLPFVLAYISSGSVGLYPLAATLVAMVVEGGKHALFHSKSGYMWINWSFLTEMLERRIAVSGFNLPANYRVLRFYVYVKHRPPVKASPLPWPPAPTKKPGETIKADAGRPTRGRPAWFTAETPFAPPPDAEGTVEPGLGTTV